MKKVSVAAQTLTSTSEHDHEHDDGQADLAGGTCVTVFPPSPTSVLNYAGPQEDDNDNGTGDASISTSTSSGIMKQDSDVVCDHPIIDHPSPQEGDGNNDKHQHNAYLTPVRRQQGSQPSQPHPLQSQASHTAHGTSHAHGRRRRSAGDVYTMADLLRVTNGTGEDGDSDPADELLHDLDRDLTLLSKQWSESQSCHKQQKQKKQQQQNNIQATCHNSVSSSKGSRKGSRKGSDKQLRSVSTGSVTNASQLTPDCAKLEAQAIHFMAVLDAAGLALDEHNLEDDEDYDEETNNLSPSDDEMEDEWNTLHRKERQLEREMREAERLMRAQLLLQEASLLQAQAKVILKPDDEEEEEEEGAQVSPSNLQDSGHRHHLSRHSTHPQASPSQSQKSVDRSRSARSLRRRSRRRRQARDAQEEKTPLDCDADADTASVYTNEESQGTIATKESTLLSFTEEEEEELLKPRILLDSLEDYDDAGDLLAAEVAAPAQPRSPALLEDGKFGFDTKVHHQHQHNHYHHHHHHHYDTESNVNVVSIDRNPNHNSLEQNEDGDQHTIIPPLKTKLKTKNKSKSSKESRTRQQKRLASLRLMAMQVLVDVSRRKDELRRAKHFSFDKDNTGHRHSHRKQPKKQLKES
jgi:hypothetical protein